MTLESLAEQIKMCQLCPLARERTHAVPGEGNPRAEVLFVGEGPGRKEDESGRPFVGAAGKFLDEMLASVGWKRQDVFIANVVKCRPPGNRDPEESEIHTCVTNYLVHQVNLIEPKLIVTLGRHSMKWFLKNPEPISRMHGKLKLITDKKTGKTQFILPLYHPAAALYNGGQRQTHLADFKKIPAIVEKIKTGTIGA
ncbi:MAG: uracil-DNA glycosylase [bacterium]|nr:uracil-DNA glycosylase [bacterium]